MRVDWCVSSWFRIKNTHSLTLDHDKVVSLNVADSTPFPRPPVRPFDPVKMPKPLCTLSPYRYCQQTTTSTGSKH